ncbi:Glucan endo-1,3-beta-glucosidase 7 [Platanthera guangdongensis]|uniref:Glucan endo-1,3-beta-glucosidase 7 n=1 Tax=Platanthera guangdongensis TaxID=2320717 RepID=A0ABR2MEA0_9ASPA
MDAIKIALRSSGFPGQEVVVAETGWPYKGDNNEVGASVENAKAYNGNLVAHLGSMTDPVETYIFAMYDEDLKPGPTSERSFGLFQPDLTPTYDIGLLKSGSQTAVSSSPAVPAEMSKPTDQCAAGDGGAPCSRPLVEYLRSASARSSAGVRRWLSWKGVTGMLALGSIFVW